MSLIKLDGVKSLSAPTKAQKDAAVYMFGPKGHAIVTVLEKLSKAKELRAPHVQGLLAMMKDGEDDEIIKFVASAAGKKSLAAAKQFATAKTLLASIKALKMIRVPVKWVAGHSDAAAARINETKEIRARKTAGNKPEKPIKLDNPHAPEATTTTKVSYSPSGKSDITLVDELAETPARKIAAKPLQAREEYFNALRNVMQNNLPKREVSATSNGVVIAGAGKLFTLRLDNNAWTLQTGATGKPKKVGTTFDIVDLLGMIDKGIMRPKPDGRSIKAPYFEKVQKVGSEYRTIVQANEQQAFDVRFKRDGDTFVFSTPVYSDVQRFVTQGMEETGIKWETFTGKSVTFSKADADKFEKWLKTIRTKRQLTSNRTFPAIAPTRKGGGMSM